MVISKDIIVGSLIGIVCIIILLVRSRPSVRRDRFILLIINGFLTGFAIYTGIVSITFSIFEIIIFNQTNIVNQKVIAFLGGVTLISISLYYLFINKQT